VREAFQNLALAGERLKLADDDSRTLEQIIDVSFAALRSDRARQALEHLSIFRPKPHAFSKEMARRICDAASDALYELSDVGLLEHHGRGDYTMHRIISDYARNRLQRPQRLRLHRRALDWYGRGLEALDATTGDDGLYSARQPAAVIRRYLRAARKIKALLLLDIQPGASDFFTEARRLERWLREPDVGLALDPEWRVQAGQVPGQVIGRVDSREVNAVTAWLPNLAKERELPEKLVVIHQFTDDMVDDTTLKARDRLQIVLNADGFGTAPVKKSKYDAFTRRAPGFEPGFKLFYEEDVGLMTPRQVLALRPPPDFVVYE